MTTYYIEAVHLVPGASPRAHEHIGSVKFTTGEVVQRSAVISGLRTGDRYFTNASPPASVYAHACPYCGASDYITTIPDNTTANNLLNLPRFSPECPIDWQPNALAPVFYGVRDYVPGTVAPGGPPTDCRIFFPSLDGAVFSAQILEGCGRYPLILFAHGNCPFDVDQHKTWFHLPAQLARSGCVVVAPLLHDIASSTDPLQASNDLTTLADVLIWMRSSWEYRQTLMPGSSTGMIGHSWGAILTGRFAVENPGSVTAYASLSGEWSDYGGAFHLQTLGIPKLMAWGTGLQSPEPFTVLSASTWGGLPGANHKAVFAEAEHWDYLPPGQTNCEVVRGPYQHEGILTGDIVTMFFAKYLPPEHWPNLGTQIPDSLIPPTLAGLSFAQQSFVGGWLQAFSQRIVLPGALWPYGYLLALEWRTSQSATDSLKIL